MPPATSRAMTPSASPASGENSASVDTRGVSVACSTRRVSGADDADPDQRVRDLPHAPGGQQLRGSRRPGRSASPGWRFPPTIESKCYRSRPRP